MRIFIVKIFGMKTRVNLTIEEDVLKKAKKYAAAHDISVSELVETYLIKISAKKEPPLFIKMLEDFKPKGNYNDRDLKKEYYEAKGKRYGL